MNKKEQLFVKELTWKLRVQGSLRHTTTVMPDIPIPRYPEGMTKGFLPVGMGGYHPRVEVACSTSALHAVGRNDRTDSQNGRALFSTKLLALRAMRNQMEQEYGKSLARIDEAIEAEELASGVADKDMPF